MLCREDVKNKIYFSFHGGTQHVTKWHWNWFPGLILNAFCTIVKPDPSGGVLGSSLAGERPKSRQKFKSIFQLLIMTATKLLNPPFSPTRTRGSAATGQTSPRSERASERVHFRCSQKGFEFFSKWGVGGRTGNRRFLAAPRPNPAPGGLGKGPGRGPARFASMFSPVE